MRLFLAEIRRPGKPGFFATCLRRCYQAPAFALPATSWQGSFFTMRTFHASTPDTPNTTN